MHSHQTTTTTREALLDAGAAADVLKDGLDLAAMLRILETLGFRLSKDESKAAEK